MEASQWWTEVYGRYCRHNSGDYVLDLARSVVQTELTRDATLTWDEATVRSVTISLECVGRLGRHESSDRLVDALYPALLRWGQYCLATLLVTYAETPAERRLEIGLQALAESLGTTARELVDHAWRRHLTWSQSAVSSLVLSLGWPEDMPDITQLGAIDISVAADL